MCVGPLAAYRANEVNPATGKRPLVFKSQGSFSGVKQMVPCGRCIECRLEHSRMWAVRCMHELQCHPHDKSSFITLTYDDKHLPENGSLVKRDLQLFMKRLRREMGNGVRFYGCGEYGGMFNRPHYHVLLFNRGFGDRKFYQAGKREGENYYTSKLLGELWSDGNGMIGKSIVADVTFDTCAYVARYVVDKFKSKDEQAVLDHYMGRAPEFSVMSRRPGIGRLAYEKWREQWYARDRLVMNGAEMKPPRYYDTLYDIENGSRLDKLKRERRRKALLNKDDRGSRRLRVRELVTLARMKNAKGEL